MSIFSFRNTNNAPKAFLLALLLIILIESALVYFDNEMYTDLRNGVFAKIKNAMSTFPNSNYDVLFMGDCFNQTGIDPRVFDKVTGLLSFNFSTDAYHTVMSSYVMLKNYLLSNKKKPKYVFIGFLPKVWSQKKEGIVRDYLFALYDYKEGNFSLFVHEFGLVNTLKLYVPVLKHQDFLKKTTLHELFWRIRSKEQIDQRIMDDVLQYRGVFFPIEWRDLVRVPNPPKECYQAPSVSPFFKKYMEKMLELCRLNDVKVFYIVPAAPPAWAEEAQQCQYNEEIWKYLDDLKNKFNNLSVIDPQTVLNEKHFYYNELHLNTNGAAHFSKYLADVINQKERRF